ncbi:MAG: hypothetical protein B5M48_00840 [Candidatus Omnitrophica bacterium 4484_213]|nr:MAG: hypothetical protein B5M48_00840 [Candidatus Omnitrophica bacterium 4484_213]
MNKIGLIAGEGRFPFLFAQAAKMRGAFVSGFAFLKLTDKKLKKYVDEIFWLNVGELNKLLELFKQNRIEKAIMAGKIPKVLLFNPCFKRDTGINSLLDKVVDKKDNSLLSAIADKLEEEGIELLDSTTFLSHLLAIKETLSKREPSTSEWEDIYFGKDLAKRMSDLDIGQSVVVKDKAILAIEAIEGTDAAVRRGGRLAQRGAVVVKMSSPRQDMRFDIPVVGPQTIRSLIKAKAKVLAIEAGKTLIIDRKEAIRLADNKGIAVVAI